MTEPSRINFIDPLADQKTAMKREMARIAREWADLRPAHGFNLIMADPPWDFDNWSKKGEAKNPKAHYDCQPLDWIKALPIDALAADNCLLWLWAINPMVPQAIAVVEAWGFQFGTMGHWSKRTTNAKHAFGPGYLLKGSSEPFILARRGRPPTTRSHAVRSTLVDTDAEGENDLSMLGITLDAIRRDHSRKPDMAYDAARAIGPDLTRRFDMFSRERREGWVSWGNETEKFEGEIA